MGRLIMVKISDPKPCNKCERIMQVNEWAQAQGSDGFTCSRCLTEGEDAA